MGLMIQYTGYIIYIHEYMIYIHTYIYSLRKSNNYSLKSAQYKSVIT